MRVRVRATEENQEVASSSRRTFVYRFGRRPPPERRLSIVASNPNLRAHQESSLNHKLSTSALTLNSHGLRAWRIEFPLSDPLSASGFARNPGENKRPGILFPRCRVILLATSYSRTTYRCTTIGAAAFHFRVRNGNGWGHCAKVTRNLADLNSDLIGG